MDTPATKVLIIATLLFIAGLLALFALRSPNRRSLRLKNSSGVFIVGDHNNVDARINQAQPAAKTTPPWQKIATVIAWLATLAGPVIAALAYWFPQGGS